LIHIVIVHDFRHTPDKINEYITEFVDDKYSRRLQCGSITPILFSINSSYPIVNNRTIRTYRSITLKLGINDKLSQKLQEYPSNTEETMRKVEFKLLEFIESVDLGPEFEVVPHSLGDPQRIKISQIISNCQKTNWVLPHFQRYFDWNRTNVKELWESIFNDYYIGSFLLWESDKTPELGIQPILGIVKPVDEIKPDAIILDGQQRMTSLYYAVKAPHYPLKGSKDTLYFYIDFAAYLRNDKKNGFIEVHAKKLSKDACLERLLFPLYELEKYSYWVDDLEDFLLSKSEHSEKIRKIRRIIDRKLRHMWEGFEIPFISLPVSMGLSQVTDIFENLNSKGKPLSVFDLLIARLYKYNIELKKLWDTTLSNYSNIKRYYKNGRMEKIPIYILQALSLLYEKNSSCKRSDILDIYSNIYEKTDRDFEEDWEDISEYLDKAIKSINFF